MSLFSNFAASLCKFRTKQPSDIVSLKDVPLRATATGYFLNTTRTITKSLIPVIKSIYDRIPLVLEGPQNQILFDYSKISAVSSRIRYSINEMDKNLPEELNCSKFLDEAFLKLSQINLIIPNMNKIDQVNIKKCIKECMTLVDEIIISFNKILSIIPKAEEFVRKNVKSLSADKQSHAHNVTAIIMIIEKLIIDLEFLNVQSNMEEIEHWISNLSQVSNCLFSQILGDYQNTVEILKLVTHPRPSLFYVLSKIHEQCFDTECFVSAADHTIALFQISFYFESQPSEQTMQNIIPQISSLLLDKLDLIFLLKKTKSIHNLSMEKISEGSYTSYGSDTIAAGHSIMHVLDLSLKEEGNIDLQALSITASLIFYALTISDYNAAAKILSSLLHETSVILKNIFRQMKEIIIRVSDICTTDKTLFDKKVLENTANLIAKIRAIEVIDEDSTLDYPIFYQIFDLIGSFPLKVTKLSESCIDNSLKNRLSKEHDLTSILVSKFYKWMHQYNLAISVNVILRCEFVFNTLIFLQHDQILKSIPENVLNALNGMYTIFQRAPQYILTDIEDLSNLAHHFLTIQMSTSAILSALDACNSTVIGPLVNTLMPSLKRVLMNNIYSDIHISSILEHKSTENLLFSVISYITQMIPLVEEAQTYFHKSHQSFAFFFSIPLTGIYTLCAKIHNNASNAVALIEFPITAKASLDVFWPIAGSVALGINKPSEDCILILYSNSLPRLLNETLLVALSISQNEEKSDTGTKKLGKITVDDEGVEFLLKETEKYETLLKGFPKNVQIYGNYLISWAQDRKIKGGFEIMKMWFDVYSNNHFNYINAAKGLKKVIADYLQNEKTSLIDLIYEHFCYLSVSFAKEEEKFGNQNSQIIESIQKSLYKVFNKILRIGDKKINKLLLFLFSITVQIETIRHVVSIDEEQFINMYSKECRNLIYALSHVDSKKVKEVMLSIVETVSRFLVFDNFALNINQKCSMNCTSDVKTILKSLLNKKTIESSMKKVLHPFFKHYTNLSPLEIASIDAMNDISQICKHITLKSDSFYSVSNNILKETSLRNLTDFELAEQIRRHNSLLLEASSFALQGLVVQKRLYSQLSLWFVESMSTIFRNLIDYDSAALSLHTQNPADSSCLQQINGVLSDNLDNFIYFIETPPPAEPVDSKFVKLVRKMFVQLGSMLVDASHIIVGASNALCNQMYSDINTSLVKKLRNTYEFFIETVTTIRSKAVGPTANDIVKVIEEIEKKFNEFIRAAKHVDFSASFPSLEMLGKIKDFSQKVHEIYCIAPTLTDLMIVEPDPAAAEMVPLNFDLGKFVMPDGNKTEMKKKCLNELNSAQMIFVKLLNDEVIKLFNDPETQSISFIELIRKVDSQAKKVVFEAKKINSLCFKVFKQKQTSDLMREIIAFGICVTRLHAATRKRLLRSSDFEEDWKESLALFEPQLKLVCQQAETELKKQEEKKENTISNNTINTSSPKQDEEFEDLILKIKDNAKEINIIKNQLCLLIKKGYNEQNDIDPFKFYPERERDDSLNDLFGSDDSEDNSDDNSEDLDKSDVSNKENGNIEKRSEDEMLMTDINEELVNLPLLFVSSSIKILDLFDIIIKAELKIITSPDFPKNRRDKKSFLFESNQKLYESSEIINLVSEVLFAGNPVDDIEYKVIVATNFIKENITFFTSQLLIGNNKFFKIIQNKMKAIDKIVELLLLKSECISKQKLLKSYNEQLEDAKNDSNKAKLEARNKLNECKETLSKEENFLYQFKQKYRK